MSTSISYSSTGVDYGAMDPVKRLAQLKAKATAKNLERLGMSEVAASRGESAYVWEEKNSYRALVIEGLGTKNLVADAIRAYTHKTHYDSIAQDTVAMIVNDLIVVGADPQVINAYFGLGSSEWLNDEERANDLVDGWAKACDIAGAVWGGGETPTLKGIIHPESIDLSGSAIGIIQPKERLCLGDKLTVGDAIVLIESSGIHANGLSLAREIARKIPDGYQSVLNDGATFGEALVTPTIIYAPLVREYFEAGIDIHYMVNITGHGWRKLMRAQPDFVYELEKVTPVQPVFDFIQQHSGNDDKEMYGNFNMGAGFAFFIPEKQVSQAKRVAKKIGLTADQFGTILSGKKKVVIKPKNLEYLSEELGVR